MPRWIGWATVTAAAVVVAFLGGRYFGPDEARASRVLRDVQAVHSGPIDRCYQVQYAPDPRHWDKKKKLEGPSHSVLWTRGDRFWSNCAIADIELIIGREEGGTLWISLSPKKGIRFANDASQLPAEVSLICDINSMSVPQLIEDVLANFDLRVEQTAGHGNGNRTLVWASLQPDRTHPLLSDAMLEIDAEKNLLVRLVLWTVRESRPKGTVTYTLLESSRQSDEEYRLQSHLDADAEIEIQTMNPRTKDSK